MAGAVAGQSRDHRGTGIAGQRSTDCSFAAGMDQVEGGRMWSFAAGGSGRTRAIRTVTATVDLHQRPPAAGLWQQHKGVAQVAVLWPSSPICTIGSRYDLTRNGGFRSQGRTPQSTAAPRPSAEAFDQSGTVSPFSAVTCEDSLRVHQHGRQLSLSRRTQTHMDGDTRPAIGPTRRRVG